MQSPGKIQAYVKRIEKEFTEKITSYEVVRSGWSHIVFIINKKWIWRFARDKLDSQIALERDFLPAFQKVCPVEIPSIMSSGTDFLAYPMIQGDPLTPERLSLFTATQKNEMIKSLGMFLTSLHSFKFTHSGLREAPYGCDDFHNDLWPAVSKQLADRARNNAQRYFSKALSRIGAVPVEKRLIHAGLIANNILVDIEKNRMTGIIDFGDLHLGDPAYDFATLFRNYGRRFVVNLLKQYRLPVGNNIMERIRYESRKELFFMYWFAKNHGFESKLPGIVWHLNQEFRFSGITMKLYKLYLFIFKSRG